MDRRGGGRREMPVVGVHDSFLKNSSHTQKSGDSGCSNNSNVSITIKKSVTCTLYIRPLSQLKGRQNILPNDNSELS